jgi:hypothetical protein
MKPILLRDDYAALMAITWRDARAARMIALLRTRLQKKTSRLRQAATPEKNLLELLLDNSRPLSKMSFCD